MPFRNSIAMPNNYNSKSLDCQLSDAITWLRFPLILLIIMLHCYSTVNLPGSHEAYFNTVYPFALWLGETGVPGFFVISGYLFFLSKKSYRQKISSRVHTLLIPYVLWNSLLLIFYLLALALGHPQDINGKSIAAYTYIDYLRLFWDRGNSFDNGNFVPLLCPLWYIRNLLIVSFLSPFFYFIIRYAREAFLFIVTVWWLITYHNAFIQQTILFFSLGAYFSIHDINPLQKIHERKGIILFLFVFFFISDIVSHTIYITPVNLQIHRLALILNIPALLLIAEYCVHHHVTNQMLPKAAFIVFCVHYPIVVVLRKFCVSYYSNAPSVNHILMYFACVIATVLLSIGIFLFLNNFFPNVKNVLSGNR